MEHRPPFVRRLRSLPGWLVALVLMLPGTGLAATITVNSNGDPAAFNPAVTLGTLGATVTLRDAVNAANNTPGDDIIEFAPALAGQTIRLLRIGDATFGPSAFKIPAGSGITLRGPSGNGGGITIARDRTRPLIRPAFLLFPAEYGPETAFRFFYVETGASLGLARVTLADGTSKGGEFSSKASALNALVFMPTGGQAIYRGGAGAGIGGAIVNAGSLTLDSVLLNGNAAHGGAGGEFEPFVDSSGLGLSAETGSFSGNVDDVGRALLRNNAREYLWGNPYEFLGQGLGGDNAGNRRAGTFGMGGGSDAVTSLRAEQVRHPVGGFSTFNTPGTGPGELGGFGGGGGGSRSVGGNGGFGGGGGSAPNQGGLGGFGGGNGSATISGAGAGFGGAIFNYGGSVRGTNSTFFGNVASGASGLGGAIFNLNGVTELVHCTLARNQANQGGGAIYSLGDNGIATQDGPALPSTTATVALWNSLLVNTPGDAADFIQNARASDGIRTGAVSSSGSGNIVARTPDGATGFGGAFVREGGYLDALADNGGPTRTMMPFASPTIGGGVTGLGVTVDQRGVSRVSPFSPGTPTPGTIGSVDQTKPSALRTRFVRSRSDPDFNLVAAARLWPRGGTLIGSGLTGSETFSPGVATLGTNHLIYLVTDAFARSSSTTLEVVIEPGDPTLADTRLDPDAEFVRSLHDVGIPLGQVLRLAPEGGITEGNLAGIFSFEQLDDLARDTPLLGTFHHPAVQRGVFLPHAAGVGLHRVYYYHPGTASRPPRFATFQIRVRDMAPTQPQLVRGALPIQPPRGPFAWMNPGWVDDGTRSIQVSEDVGPTDFGANFLFTGFVRKFFSEGFGSDRETFDPSVTGPGSTACTVLETGPFGFNANVQTWYLTVLSYPPLYVPPGVRDSDLLLDDAPVRLTRYAPIQRAGGTYSGPGVGPDGIFTPSAAGLGSHTLTYTIAEGATARQTTTFVIRVVQPDPTITIPVRRFERVVNQPAVDLAALTSASPAGGTFSGPGVAAGVFTPSTAGLGHHRIRYTLPDGASSGFSITVTDVPFPVVDDLNLASLELNCSISDPLVDLMALIPPDLRGGRFIGPGIAANRFLASAMGVGRHTISYHLPPTATQGARSSTLTVNVRDLDPVVFGMVGDRFRLHLYDLPRNLHSLTGVTPADGEFSGPGVSSGLFNPAAAGVGTHTVRYTVPANSTRYESHFDFTIRVVPGIEVTTTVDEDDGNPDSATGTGTSLREAIAHAASLGGARTVEFAETLAGQTFALSRVGDSTFGPSALRIPAGADVTVDGLVGTNGVTIARDTNAAPVRLRLFHVEAGASLTLKQVTVSRGRAVGGRSNHSGGGAGLGGAIVNSGTLNVVDSLLTENEAEGGSTDYGDYGMAAAWSGASMAAGPTSPTPYGITLVLGVGPGPETGFGSGGAFFFDQPGNRVWANAGGFGGGGSVGGNGGFGGGAGQTFPGFSGIPALPVASPGFGGGLPDDSGFVVSGLGFGGAGAGMGGAIFNHGGTVRLTNSTLTANVARGGLGQSPTANGSGFGGAVFNLNGSVQAVFTTLAGNTAPQGGGALFSLGDNGVATQAGPALPSTPAQVTLKNSILSDSAGGVPDFVQRISASNGTGFGTVLSDGDHNLIETPASGDEAFGGTAVSTDPQLAALADNGGATRTMALPRTSPAAKAAEAVAGITLDQRGVVRATERLPDLGAFQLDIRFDQLEVTTLTDEDDGNADPDLGTGTSLREAIAYAATLGGSPTVTFSPNLTAAGRAVLVVTNELLLTQGVRIEGSGSDRLLVSGGSLTRVFHVASGGSATLTGLAILQGAVDGTNAVTGFGGGILNEGDLEVTQCLIGFNGSGGVHPGSGAAIHHQGGSLVLRRSTLVANSVQRGGPGGALACVAGTVAISECAFIANFAYINDLADTAGSGGAIANLGAALAITNSTFSGNVAMDGGAIYHEAGTLTLRHCTVSGNEATRNGGGLLRLGRTGNTVSLANTLVATNTAAGMGPDLFSQADATDGSFTTLGGNLIGIADGGLGLADAVNDDRVGSLAAPLDPLLDTLRNNGGYGATLGLRTASPAIGSARVTESVATDQRGFPRDAAPDIGAFESGLSAPTITSTNRVQFVVGVAAQFPITVTGEPTPRIVSTGTLPPGLSLDADGLLSGTPAPDSFGFYPVTIQATNGLVPAATQTLTVVVTTPSGEMPPRFTSAANATFTPGQAGSFQVRAVGVPTPTVHLVGGSLPPGLELGSAGVLTGTPGTNGYGTYTAVVAARNGVAPVATQTLRITVNPPSGAILVTTTVDENNGSTDPRLGTGTSLREALIRASGLGGSQTVSFSPALASATFRLRVVGDSTFGPSALRIPAGANVRILGPQGDGRGVTLARDEAMAPERLRLFHVAAGGELTLDRVTLSGGLARGGSSVVGGGGAGLGGAVVNLGTLRILNSLVLDNRALGGGLDQTVPDGIAGGGLSTNGVGPIVSGTGAQAPVFGLGGSLIQNPGSGSVYPSPGGFGAGGSWGGDGGFGGGGGLGVREDSGTVVLPLGRPGFGGGTPGPIGVFNQAIPNAPGAGAGFGGAVFNHGGTVHVLNSTFTGNVAQGGVGGVLPENDGAGLGGAIFNLNGTVQVAFSTLARNTAAQGGGAIYSLGDNGIATQSGPAVPAATATVTLHNSILSDTPGGAADFVQNTHASNGTSTGSVASSGTDNLIETQGSGPNAFAGVALSGDPQLRSLASNGGPTRSLAPAAGSPAIDAAADLPGFQLDQRGVARRFGAFPDLGSVESDPGAEQRGPATTRIERVLGFGPGRGLDLAGDFLHAFNVGPTGAAGQAGDAVFTADNAPGITVHAPNNPIANWNNPDFGNTAEDDVLETVYRSIRWADHRAAEPAARTLRVDLAGLVPGRRYKLQLLFGELHDTGRRFDILVDGVRIVDDFDPASAQGGVPMSATGSAVVHEFFATGSTVRIVLDGTDVASVPGLNRDPYLNGATLEALPSGPTAVADSLDREAGSRVAKVLRSQLLANDFHQEGRSLSVVSVGSALPSGASVGISGNFVVYTAPSSDAGSGSFTYTVSDGVLTSTTTVTVAATGSTAVAEAPNAARLTASGADIQVRFLGVPGRTYGVQYTANTSPPYTWNEMPVPVNLVAPPSGVLTFTDVNPLDPVRLYRVILRR
jgi:CSLREA domain-containing protein